MCSRIYTPVAGKLVRTHHLYYSTCDRFLLSPDCMAGTVLGIKDTVVNIKKRRKKYLCSWSFHPYRKKRLFRFQNEAWSKVCGVCVCKKDLGLEKNAASYFKKPL
jgi:hypothetical protein